MLPGQGGRAHRENDGEETGTCADFLRMEHTRRRTARTQSLRGIADQETQGERTRAAKQPAIQKPCEKMTEAIVIDGGLRCAVHKLPSFNKALRR
jgi:hypothetical protein